MLIYTNKNYLFNFFTDNKECKNLVPREEKNGFTLQGKEKLFVHDLGDWEEDRENEEDEEEEYEAFDWSKPIHINMGYYVHLRDVVAANLALKIEKKE